MVRHLVDPGEFWTLHPVPSLSKDDPNYSPFGAYWRGGVWPPTNYMIAEGLTTRGRPALARELAVKHLEGMAAVWSQPEYATLWEAYAPDHERPSTVKESEDLVRPHFVGWTGLGPIAMLIEHVFGLSFDAAANRIGWDIGLRGRHGVENLVFNGRTVSLVCSGFRSDGGPITVEAETTAPVELALAQMGSRLQTHRLPAGRHTLAF
jgi:hypothetical protein